MGGKTSKFETWNSDIWHHVKTCFAQVRSWVDAINSIWEIHVLVLRASWNSSFFSSPEALVKCIWYMHQLGISWIAVSVLHVSNSTDGSKSAMYRWSTYWKIRDDMSVNNIGEIITRKYWLCTYQLTHTCLYQLYNVKWFFNGSQLLAYYITLPILVNLIKVLSQSKAATVTHLCLIIHHVHLFLIHVDSPSILPGKSNNIFS